MMAFLTALVILACMYAILAAGFVIIYKSSRILNFAHAEIGLLIAYILVTLLRVLPGPPVVSIAVTLILSFFLGLLIHALLIRPLAGQPVFATILLTVALGIVLQSIAILIWHGSTEIVNFGWRRYYAILPSVRISSVEIIIVGTALFFFAALLSFYKYSRVGWLMRATAENVLLAAQRGININFVMALSWGIGTFAIGVGAVLLGGYSSVSLSMTHMAIKAFAVSLVGGLDSVKGIVPAAAIVAAAELTANQYVNPRLADAIPFLIMLIVLVIRPWGLFGTEEEHERV
jgi:branched-chain amino acid transport system permease protein